MTTVSPLATLDELTHPLVLLEVGREPGEATVPGAHRVSLADVAGPELPDSGRFPLPEHSTFVAWLRGIGIGPTTRVVSVASTEGDLSAAARVWVTLRWAGVQDVRVFSGTSADLKDVRLPLAAGDIEGDYVIDDRVTVDLAAIEALPEGTRLIDARPAEAYSKRHIPGAVSLPSALLSDGALLKSPLEIRETYSEAIGDVDEVPIVAYCGGGVAASLQALALATAGVEAPVYIGSWSEWSKHHGEQSA